MIAKNEEHNIGRCLRSVKGVVDEIIVVDTGSSDKTCQIAQGFGAKVRSFIWNDNFSDARNASLDLATGDWILFLDADEELAKKSRAILRQAVLQPGVEGYFIKIVNVAGNDSCPETNADTVFRLFRNRPDYRFRGAVHEQICNVIIEKKGQVQFPFIEDLIINHYGYLNSEIEGKDKKRRNRALLEKELINNPEDCLVRFHYAVELFRMGENLSAAQEFERVSTIVNPKEVIYGPRLMRYIALAYYGANELPAALTAVQRGLALFPDYADLYYYGGALYYQLKEYGLSYEYFQKAIEALDQPVYYATGSGIQGFRSYYYLGQIAEKFCNEEEALRYYIESLRDNSSFPAALESIMGILQPRENPDYTKYAIGKICDVSVPQAKLLMGNLLFRYAAYGLALEYFEDVPEALVTNELLLYKAICLMQQRRGLEALTVLELIERSGSFNPNVKFNKLLCFWLEDNRQKVWEFGEELLSSGLTEDTATVVELLRNSHADKTPKVLGSEGMTPILEALSRALDLGECKRCTLLLSGISPQSLRNYYLTLGELFYRYRHLELAEQYLCQYIEENSGGERAYFLLAEIKQSQGAYFAAIDYYQQAMQFAPQEPKYYVKLIKLYEKVRSELLKQATEKYSQFPILATLLEETRVDT
jgi:glycosyltransferase involved in cell wall biosynthesis